MKFTYEVEQDNIKIKTFLAQKGISKRLLAKIKFAGGLILVNGQEEIVTCMVNSGDTVEITIPSETPSEKLLAQKYPLDVIFEDEHFLVINKPAGFASVTSSVHPNNTISNFVQDYLIKQDYENKKVHIVTRLDRDTSGLMLFAKHGFAHSHMDKMLQDRTIEKKYYALVESSDMLEKEGEIILPIDREEGSIIKRCVAESGKQAHTSYKLLEKKDDISLLDIKLHTGRTHQIRVHFSHLGAPLLGDDLYGGSINKIQRQALHCRSLEFIHPFTNEKIKLEANLPEDMRDLINE
ncbi:RluA family pseudouridine synthase [Floricoccus penangensis]|uniref:RluA family pseudouridine synthase n=1 Tax=Floricoccus penangensis TaxID=1859475 RepID=UPI00203E1EFB|nr:RluA family pseudouridine synthase [Floricoccus penangensis]URZ87158.1 RluA family pseudouridine synthase [Floricoccus penangensis]